VDKPTQNEEKGPTQKDRVKEFIKNNPGKTAVQIAKATGIRAANVSSILVKGLAPIGPFKREKPDGTKGWIYFIV
jgi:hypothetical protein